MLNFYELLRTFGLENTDAVNALMESFHSDWINTYNGIQVNKTTRKNAVASYTKHDNFMMDNDVKGLYTDGVTFLSLPASDAVYTSSKTCDIAKNILPLLKTMKPVSFHVKESYAVAKNIGWNAGTLNKDKPYFIEIEGNYYNFSLVWSMFSCIADNSNKWNPVEVKVCTENKPGTNMLILQSKYGMTGILPFYVGDRGCYNAHNVDYNYYSETINEIESYQIEQYKKLA